MAYANCPILTRFTLRPGACNAEFDRFGIGASSAQRTERPITSSIADLLILGDSLRPRQEAFHPSMPVLGLCPHRHGDKVAFVD